MSTITIKITRAAAAPALLNLFSQIGRLTSTQSTNSKRPPPPPSLCLCLPTVLCKKQGNKCDNPLCAIDTLLPPVQCSAGAKARNDRCNLLTNSSSSTQSKSSSRHLSCTFTYISGNVREMRVYTGGGGDGGDSSSTSP